MKKPRLGELTRAELSRLRDDGIELTDEEIIWIYKLGSRAETGVTDSRYLIWQSVKMGGIEVYPLTIGAKLWYETEAMPWFEGDETMLALAFLWCAANAREPDRFIFKSKVAAEKKLIAWGLRIDLTEEETLSIVSEATQDYKDQQQPAEAIIADLVGQIKNNLCDVNITDAEKWLDEECREAPGSNVIAPIAILQHYFGKDKNYWLWEISDEECADYLKQASLIERRKSGEATDDKFESGLKPFKELRRVAKLIKGQHNG